MLTNTEKTTRNHWAKKDQAMLNTIITPIRTAFAKGEEDCDVLSQSAAIHLGNPALKDHSSGEKRVKFAKWHNSHSHQQRVKFKKMAKPPSNNKAAAKPPKKSLSSVPLNKDELDCIKFIASEKM